MRIITTAILGGSMMLLAACSSEKSGTINTDDGTAEYRVDQSTGETSMTITTDDGKATMRSGTDIPISLPKGFSLYPGTKVLSNTVVNQPGGSGSMVLFESEARAEQVLAYYKQQAEKAGFKIELEANMGGTVMIAGKREADGGTFSVNASPDDEGKTTGQLIVGSEKGG
jgi:hypothetical protein